MFHSFLLGGPTTDRTGAAVAELMTKFAAPAAVAGADDADLTNHAPLAVNFADRERTYPIHTPKAAWASAAFYHATGSSDDTVASRIKEACVRHRLFGEWDRLSAVARPGDTPPAVHYALSEPNRYPLQSPGQLKSAADYFATYADRFDPMDRREFALSVVGAMERHPGTLTEKVAAVFEAEAGLGRLAGDWKWAFDDRIRLATMENQPELVEALKEASSVPPPDIAVAAAVLREVDQRNRWKLDDPLAAMSDLTPTEARRKLAGVTLAADGSWYEKAALDAVPDEAVSALFDAPVVVSSATRSELLASPEKSAAFRQVLADHEVFPVEEPRRRVDWAAVAALGAGSGQ